MINIEKDFFSMKPITFYSFNSLKYLIILMVFLLSFNVSVSSNDRLWDLEPTFWDAAQGVTVTTPIVPDHPLPAPRREATNLGNTKLMARLWGPADKLTLNLRKTDVWDRRVSFDDPVSPETIRLGAFDPANERAHFDKDGKIPRGGMWGYPLPGGGRDGRWGFGYEFPCPKPVGQVILSMPDFQDVDQPNAVRLCQDGSSKVTMSNGDSHAEVTYITQMDENVIGIEVNGKNLHAPVYLRLYRHKDTITQRVPIEGNKRSQKYLEESPWNGPIDPPTSGVDGEYFWIRQELPADQTFPNGFVYYLVGRVEGNQADLQAVQDQYYLGHNVTIPPNPNIFFEYARFDKIRSAPGAAATASFSSGKDVTFSAYITVVTGHVGDDLISKAKSDLSKAIERKINGIRQANENWFKDLLDSREDGRVFDGTPGFAKFQIPDLVTSWTGAHMPHSAPDPYLYESDGNYNVMGDSAPWHGLPCYNELYFTHVCVRNQSDRLDYYSKLVNLWLDTCRNNAKDMFGMPGMYLAHGYLPPIEPDGRYPHVIFTWEYCMEIPAQVMKLLWDTFDYGGDETYLKEKVYPALRDLAEFYSAYASKGDDGLYHVIPTMSAEHWGWTYQFERNRDSTSALTMFKWTFKRAALASEILGVDADLREQWLKMADEMAPYPTWETEDGPVFTDVRDVNPFELENGYSWFAGVTPTLLSDEINLDSDPKDIEIMLRTGRKVKRAFYDVLFPLLGEDHTYNPYVREHPWRSEAERLLNSRSGTIHLFPSVHSNTTIAFKRFQARGGFLVSAEIREGNVSYVLLESRRNVICKIKNPWMNEKIQLIRNGKNAETITGEVLEFKAESGESIEIKVHQ